MLGVNSQLALIEADHVLDVDSFHPSAVLANHIRTASHGSFSRPGGSSSGSNTMRRPHGREQSPHISVPQVVSTPKGTTSWVLGGA